LIVKSPGIPQGVPILQQLREAGRPVIGEIEFAWQHCGGTVIAITGSNGKTTTTRMIHEMMMADGRDAQLCGNIGASFAGIVARKTSHWYVVEVSSFQLEDISTFRPHIAVITNIYENHLNRYGSMVNYAAAKMRILANQGPEDHLVYNLDSTYLTHFLAQQTYSATAWGFAYDYKPGAAAWIENSNLVIDMATNSKTRKNAKKKTKLPIEEMQAQGRHNRYNAMASGVTGNLVGLRKEAVKKSLTSFENSEHRLEELDPVTHVWFINDSKATNVNAVWFALDSRQGPIVWIAGGQDKGNDYGMLKDVVRQKVKAIVLLGEHIQPLREAFENEVPTMKQAHTMEEAVRTAYHLAEREETVMLSPACASFDLFESYEDRGDQFKAAVRNLQQEEHKEQ
jgi:UDP-N-acetylmuramoylalanine--D-glutamate ligase